MIIAIEIAVSEPGSDVVATPSWSRRYAVPRIDPSPRTAADLALFLRGEPEADDCERLLVWACRARGAIDLALGEGLDALRRGDRLATLGYQLDDCAREVLDVGGRTALELARLGRELSDAAAAAGGAALGEGPAPRRRDRAAPRSRPRRRAGSPCR